MTEPFDSPYYRLCEDRNCPLWWAYERDDGTHDEHHHFIGSPHHPAWGPDATGA